MKTLDAVFSDQGVLAKTIDNFHSRPEQIRLAAAIDRAIQDQSLLIAEAGTGTGKTFAYLVPVILAGKKAIVSTGTKSLQDQLFHRDLPRVIQSLALPIKTALLKGRSNYLCLYRLEHQDPDQGLFSRATLKHFQKIKRQLPRMNQGDIAELSEIPSDSAVWPAVTSTHDNCLGKDCDFYQKCFVVKARRTAMDADLVVVNHHLFFADVKIRDEGFGELLPGVDVVVFDEAHQLPEVATQFFGLSLSSRQLNELANDLSQAIMELGGDMQDLADSAHELILSLSVCRTALGPSNGRYPWKQTAQLNDLPAALAKIEECLQRLKEQVTPIVDRSPAMASSLRRITECLSRFQRVTASQTQDIQWWENYSRSFVFHLTPLTIAGEMKALLASSKKSWIFTSATLAVGDDFSHFQQLCGLEGANTLQCLSPFRYAEQALLYLPRGLPEPKHPQYVEHLFETTLPVIQAAGGGVFFLFTSYQMMHVVADRLRETIDLPVFVQGEASANELLKQFRDHGDAILLGTYSFWEGVDVKGRALRCVIIDRLPFENPSDPILQAKLELIKEQGQDPFASHQIPLAVITLKQGAGRLLRDETDQGVLMICDPRLVARAYGELFMKSLPPFRKTRDLKKVESFYHAWA